MLFQYFKPPKHLEGLVRYFWILDFDNIAEQSKEFRVFARRYPRIVFQHNNGYSAISHKSDVLPIAYIGGLNTKSYVCEIQPSIRTTGVSFYPNGLKLLFGIDCSSLVNELPDLINFVPRELIEKVIDSKTIEQRINTVSDYLTKLAVRVNADKLSVNGWRMIGGSIEYTLVKDLQQIFNVSERQLNRNFYQTVGMSPKQFLRISRFENAIHLMQRTLRGDLTKLAYELKYADQSHFIREFKSFSNFTPVQYLKVNKLHEENSAIMIR